MRIGIDIDDTLADNEEIMLHNLLEYDKKYCSGNGVVFSDRKYSVAFDWPKEVVLDFAFKNNHRIYASLPMKENADKYVKKLHELGHHIVIITARSDNFSKRPYEVAHSWLTKNNIKFDKLIISAGDKTEACEQEKIDLLIDDSFDVCLAVSKYNKIPVIMVNDKFNMDKNADGIIKAEDWQEIYKIILSLNI